MTHLLMRNSRVEEDLVDQLFNSSEKRLARTLLLLRPRVSIFMDKFRKLGFIEYNGHLEVHSSLMSVLLRE